MNYNFTPLYLYSLPRSGSTLTQRLLGAHTEVTTVAEPWLLLPLLYSLRDEGITAEYNHAYSCAALTDFLNQWPEGEQEYLMSIKRLVYDMYSHIMRRRPAAYFLDKTPRYYFVADDLLALFPEAKHVFLFRNPLAVAASLVSSWRGDRFQVHRYKKDLVVGLERLLHARKSNLECTLALRYEDLITQPVETLEAIWEYLGLNTENVQDRFAQTDLSGRMGDEKGRDLKHLDTSSLSDWVIVMNSPVRRWWCRRYLRAIGSAKLDQMGYSEASLLRELESVPLSWRRSIPDFYFCILQPVVDACRSALRELLEGNARRSRW